MKYYRAMDVKSYLHVLSRFIARHLYILTCHSLALQAEALDVRCFDCIDGPTPHDHEAIGHKTQVYFQVLVRHDHEGTQ